LGGKGERVNRIREELRIKEKARGPWAKVPFFFPPRNRTEREGGAGMAGRQGYPPAAPAAAAAGDKGKRKRGARGSYPRAHLGL
jgi:hypothetical protein